MIPSMGGTEIGPWLAHWASEVPSGHAIVEFGTWLGAGTVHLALGAKKSGAPIHCYDRFQANAEQVAHAATFDVSLREGESLLPHVIENVAPYSDDVSFHAQDLSFISWQHGPIGLYVDDASKRKWPRAWATFGKAFVAGVTRLVMMDYHFPSAKPQRDFFADNDSIFELEHDKLGGSSAAVFRYLGRAA